DAREHVFSAELPADDHGELFQDRVAGEVAVGVVLLLEIVDVEKHERKIAVVAAAARDLALERLVEVALVVDLRETIERHHSIDLFVVRRLDVVARHELQDRAADLHEVAVAKLLFGDLGVVDVGAVGRAEVLHLEAGARPPDARVAAAHRLLIDRDLAAVRAASFDIAADKGDALAELVAVDDDEV